MQQERELSARVILFHQSLAGLFGLNATDHKCLDLARREPVVTAGRLAELTGLTTGAITAVLDRLERAGFARRERDRTDRRKVIVTVLPAGQRQLAPHFAGLARAMAEVHGQYSASELELLIGYQRRCIAALQAATTQLQAPPAADKKTKRPPARKSA